MRLFGVLLPLVIAGCGGLGGLGGGPQKYTRTYQAPFDTVWTAAVQVFEQRQVELKEADKGRGKIVTDWLYRVSEKRMGIRKTRWTERYRVVLQVSPGKKRTEVVAYATAQEKRPGGKEAYRWSRMESTGELEIEVLDSIGRAVESAGKKEVEAVE
ncbi:MAG: outer membrane protein assembly factor BamC [Planctomycetes bacterium]|nr:outer membrane protein assembly factor BamC [Planctomycetota bacterium]